MSIYQYRKKMVNHVVVESFESYDRRQRDNLIIRAFFHMLVFLIVYSIVALIFYMISPLIRLSSNVILIIAIALTIYLYYWNAKRKNKKRSNKKRHNRRNNRNNKRRSRRR